MLARSAGRLSRAFAAGDGILLGHVVGTVGDWRESLPAPFGLFSSLASPFCAKPAREREISQSIPLVLLLTYHAGMAKEVKIGGGWKETLLDELAFRRSFDVQWCGGIMNT